MKKKIKGIAVLLCCAVLAFGLSACAAGTGANSPQDAIKDAYGDTQYKISFYAGNLEEPLSDIYYSANDMPSLPSPERVGYVFAGWFFDSALTDPCDVSDGDLYWKMCDVTLYAKWEKEAIVNNGTYDIEFEANIVESSVAKGILADKYGWRDFSEDIIANETYIEKNDSGTWLRVQYDAHERGPIFGEGTGTFERQAYTVTDGGTGRLSEELSVLDRTSTVQTVYYDISDIDITEPIMLYVEYYNWAADLSSGENRDNCSVSYAVQFEITRFLGFSQSFVNPEGVLEDGIYLVPTHYTELNKGAAMLDSFNPVYSYIVAEDGHYTLVKQLTAYNSDLMNLEGDDYFNRSTGYARDFTYFLTDADNVVTEEQMNAEDVYIPELLDAGAFGTLTYEFHADTGRYYYTFDLGTELDKDVILYGGSTGAMEQMFNFPFSYRRLCIGYNSMVRITDWDYTPIQGDAYTYSDSVPFYSGYADVDFADDNTVYYTLQNYAYAVRMVNMFYSSFDGGKTGADNYDSKIVISPSAQTAAAGNVSEMRYSLSYFDIVCEAYGYDPVTDGILYSNAISYLSLMRTAATNTDRARVDIGKTLAAGTEVDLVSLYQEKVYPTVTAANLSWQAYGLDANGNADFSSPVALSRIFTFEEGVAVLYTADYEYGERTCIVTLLPEEEPQYRVEDDSWYYDEDEGIWVTDERFLTGNYVPVPEITYTWLGREYTTYSMIKYEDGTDEYQTNYLYVGVWEYWNGIYQRVFSQFAGSYGEGDNLFTMSAERMRLTFRLTNRFGEWETVILEYRGNNVGNYYLTDDEENRVQSSDFTYTEGARDVIEYEEPDAFILESEADISALPLSYTMHITESGQSSRSELAFSYATVYLRGSTQTVRDTGEIWTLIENEPYAVVILHYYNDYGDHAFCSAMYNFTIDAKSVADYRFIDEGSALFTEQEFEMERPKIFGGGDISLSRGTFYVYRRSGDNYELAGSDMYTNNSTTFGTALTFLQEGEYMLQLTFGFRTDENGTPVFSVYDPSDSDTTVIVSLCRKFTVYDAGCDISVTYATDKEHPFDTDRLSAANITEDENYYYYTVTVSMAESNLSLSNVYFESTPDRLYGWSSVPEMSGRLFSAGSSIGQLGVELGTLTPTIYALWDKGITIDAYYDMDGETTEYMGSVTYYRPNNGGYANYSVSLFDFRQFYSFPDGYEQVGWRADKPVFSEGYGSDAVYSYTLDAGFDVGFNVREEFDLWVVVKKVMNVSYQAVDEQGGSLMFTSTVSGSRDVLEDSTLAENISETKLSQLQSVTCTDPTKEFMYWAVLVDGEYVRFDIENDPLLASYITSGSRIILYAVFGDKEVSV